MHTVEVDLPINVVEFHAALSAGLLLIGYPKKTILRVLQNGGSAYSGSLSNGFAIAEGLRPKLAIAA